MARQRGPYSAAFPVDFTSEGDTTRDAFRKHMDEIARIYGILTGIDADTMDVDAVSEMLQTHIDSTNPHPNYKPSWGSITGKPGLDDLSGTLTASKVRGALTGATIATGNVTGLETYVNGKIPASKGDGIIQASNNGNGYAKFNNGLILQWGVGEIPSTSTSAPSKPDLSGGTSPYQMADISFPTSFSNLCFGVVLTARAASVPPVVLNMSSFSVVLVDSPSTQKFTAAVLPAGTVDATVYYVAIGV